MSFTAIWSFLSSLPWRLIGYAVLAMALFFAGANWQKARDADAQVKATQKALTDYKAKVDKAIADSQALNERITKEIAEEHQRQIDIKDQVVAHLNSKLITAQEKLSELERRGVTRREVVEVCSVGDLYRLDDWTLGMLNSAILSTPGAASASAGTSEEGRTLTNVGATEVIEHDLTIVRMYRELAKRHDALVDWIIEKQRELTK